MTIVRQPNINVQILSSSTTTENTEQAILFVGQKTSAGSAVAGQLNEMIANGGAEDGLFGSNAMLATLIRANKVRNQQVRTDAIALDDNGTAYATGSIAVTGTATEAGTLTVIAGSERNHKYTISVELGATATAVGALIEAAVIADVETVPVSAVNAAGTVTFTAINAGTYGNSIPIEVRGVIAGLATSVTGMSGGATDPVLTGVFDVVAGKRYQSIVWAYPESTTELTSFLDPRFNADGVILDGAGFTAINDTYANLISLGDPLNSQPLVVFGGKQETEANYSGGDVVEIPLVKASVFAGLRGLRLDVGGFAISDFVITSNGALDAFGGPALASKPYFNTPLSNVLPIKTGRGFDAAEIEELQNSGISVIGNNPAGNTVITGEIVTTYKTDSAGNPDITFKYLNYVDTASQAREYFYNNLRKRFAQSRLTTGDIIRGRDSASENVIKAHLKVLFQDLTGEDFVLLEAGEDALNYFLDNLIISIDKAQGSASVQMKPIIVTQLREIAATMQIAFSTEA